MESTFQIDVITPVENINIGTSEYLRAPNLDGLFGVKARHASSIISIELVKLKLQKMEKKTSIKLQEGMQILNLKELF